MKKILFLGFLTLFAVGVFVFFKKEPWPEKYLAFFDKNEAFFQMPEFKNNCDIRDFGAVGDGKTKNTEAFAKAIESCAQKGGGNVLVPRGVWLTGAIHLKSNINLHLESGAEILFSKEYDDFLPVVQTRWEGIELFNYSPFIYAKDAENVAITGKGKLKGQGKNWQAWNDRQEEAFSKLYSQALEHKPATERIFGTRQDALRPSFVQFFNSKNILLEDFSIEDGPMWTIHMVFSQNITARNVRIASFGHNSDGFVIDSSRNVLLNKMQIASGDDAISIKSGLESDIWNRNIPSENIIIKNTFFKEGHAGVALGSEMSGGIKNVRVERSFFTNLDWALRLKSIRGRGGFIEDIRVKNLKLDNVNQVLAADLQYPAPTLIPLSQDSPRAQNISLANIQGKRINEFVYLRGLPESPLQNISFKNIQLQTKGMSEIINSQDVLLDRVKLQNAKAKEFFIENSRALTFRESRLCQKNAANCVLIDGKDNDAINFIQTNVTRQNIDLGESVQKENVTVSN